MNKNTILTIAVVIVAALAIYFAYQSNKNTRVEDKGIIKQMGDEIDEATDEVGHEIDEMKDESKKNNR